MWWVDLAVIVPIMVVFSHLYEFVMSRPPKPRWKGMFLPGAIVALIALPRVVRTDVPDAWVWTFFLIFGTVGMIVALVVIKPRGDQLMR